MKQLEPYQWNLTVMYVTKVIGAHPIGVSTFYQLKNNQDKLGSIQHVVQFLKKVMEHGKWDWSWNYHTSYLAPKPNGT